MQVQSEDLAQSLGLKTGQYMIKQLPNAAQSSPSRPKKRHRKLDTSRQSEVTPETCSANNEETENWATGESVVQTNSFDELVDPHKLLEFAISAANLNESDEFEPTQSPMQSDYLEGSVIKIAEFPGSVPEISGISSAATEDDVLLCYISHSSSQSATDLTANTDNTEQNNLSFNQSPMITSSASVTQTSTLSFPLKLTVDGSALDNCTALQFS